MSATVERNAPSITSASSSSPLLSWGVDSSGSASESESSTAGWRARKRAMASGMSVEPADSKAAIRRRPPRRPAIASSSASASASRARIASVWPTSARPASVSRTPRALRSTSTVPGLALERRDLLRDGRLGEGQCLGRGGERAAGRDLAEHAHAANVEHHLHLYHFDRAVHLG